MKVAWPILAILVAVLIVCVISSGSVRLQDVVFLRQRLEARKIKNHSDPLALQRWATNLLAVHGPVAALYYDAHCTNLPADILALYPKPPAVLATEKAVSVVWGRGHPSIHIGRPDFVLTNSLARTWIPGVYLVPSE